MDREGDTVASGGLLHIQMKVSPSASLLVSYKIFVECPPMQVLGKKELKRQWRMRQHTTNSAKRTGSLTYSVNNGEHFTLQFGDCTVPIRSAGQKLGKNI